MDAKGGVLSVSLSGANTHDSKMLSETLQQVVVGRPEPEEGEQHLCLDKAYDNPASRQVAEEQGYVPHIRRIGEEKLDEKKQKKHPARRWVAERAGAWLNGCRALLVRYAKKSSNYLGLIQLAVSLLWYRRAIQLGPLQFPEEVLR